MTHISYECAKKLKEFLKDSAPEPMKPEFYVVEWQGTARQEVIFLSREHQRARINTCGQFLIPAYQLHDLLSEPFCEAFIGKHGPFKIDGVWMGSSYLLSIHFTHAFHFGGLHAVEKALIALMEEK